MTARWPTVPIVVPRDINDENTGLSVLGWRAQDCLVKGRFHRELLVRAIHYAIECQQIEEQWRQQALRERLLGKIIEHIRSSIDAASILQSTVAEVRLFLKTDRVLIYRCQDWASQLDGEEQKGAIVAGDGLPLGYSKLPDTHALHRVRAFSSPQDNFLQRAGHYLGTSGQVYDLPQSSNISCSIHIGIANPSASLIQALKPLTLAIANHLATVTSFRGIARINQSYINAKFHAFIGQELAQLVERPTIAASLFCFRPWQFIGTLSDSGQVFQGNSLI